jgi:hypothetical protein
MADTDQRSCFSTPKADSHEKLISNAGWSKLDFAERDQCKPVLLLAETLIGWNRMEGARLWTQDRIRHGIYMYDRYGEEKVPCKKGPSLTTLKKGLGMGEEQHHPIWQLICLHLFNDDLFVYSPPRMYSFMNLPDQIHVYVFVSVYSLKAISIRFPNPSGSHQYVHSRATVLLYPDTF